MFRAEKKPVGALSFRVLKPSYFQQRFLSAATAEKSPKARTAQLRWRENFALWWVFEPRSLRSCLCRVCPSAKDLENVFTNLLDLGLPVVIHPSSRAILESRCGHTHISYPTPRKKMCCWV